MRRIGLAIATLVGLLLTLTVAVPAAASTPPGNNGTVKIESLDIDSIPDNEPHQGCVFNIEFRGYDEGDLWATVTIAAQPPSGDTVLDTLTTFIGEDAAGGANDLDAVITVDLGNYRSVLDTLFQHPEQGFHLKITVHADGSIGNDTKHKVFWVTGCAAYPPTTTATGSTLTSASAPARDDGLDWRFLLVALLLAAPVLYGTRRVRKALARSK